MLVPELSLVLQLFEVVMLSLFADTMFEPGTVISGLIRPSSVGPQDENDASEVALAARKVAPTDTALLAVDGEPTDAAPGPELPAAKKIRKSLWFHMNSSASWLPSE